MNSGRNTGLKRIIINTFLPPDSRRRQIARMFFRTIKNPLFVLKQIKIRKLLKLVYYLFTENPRDFSRRINRFFGVNQQQQTCTLSMPVIYKLTGEMIVFEENKNPLVSIVIPVHNQFEHTLSCLTSILENSKDVSYEIIIADDASTDETINILNYVRNIVLVRNEVNKGFLHNCNHAASHARGKYILFLNNDTNVQKNWLKSLVDLIESDEKIGMVGSKLVFPDGFLQEAGGIIWQDANGCNYGRLDEPNKHQYCYVKEVDYISGASIMIKAELWQKIGGFDERFAPAYYEDTDLAFEVRRNGYKVVFQPESVVVHFEGVSHGTDVSAGIKSYQVKNRYKFLEKWKEVLLQTHQPINENMFWARDRSQYKKTLLMVDFYAPKYDKDAGSRTIFQYIELFLKLGLNIKFYEHMPVLEDIKYVEKLQQMGIEVIQGDSDYFGGWLKENRHYIDFAYLHKPDPSINYIDLIKKNTKAKVIYNVADLHWVRMERQYEYDHNRETQVNAKIYKKIEFEIFEKADLILTYSDIEKAILENNFPRKPIVTQPLFIYDDTFPLGNPKAGQLREYITFVGGFYHTPNVDGIIWFMNKVWPIIRNKIPEVKFKIVGSNPPDEIKCLSNENVKVTGYVSDQTLEEYYAKTKVIVAPLRYGAGVKGKVVEAIAHGIPVVTTEVGAEGFLERDLVLYVQDDEKAFADNVIKLILDDDLWREKHEACVEYANKYFSAKGAKELMLNSVFGETMHD